MLIITFLSVFVREYGPDSPVPGECNTKPGVLVKPYLEISWQDPLVHLQFSQAAQPMPSCANIDGLVYQVSWSIIFMIHRPVMMVSVRRADGDESDSIQGPVCVLQTGIVHTLHTCNHYNKG